MTRLLWVAVCLLLLVGCGEQAPLSRDRRFLPAPALAGACWPLPDTVSFDFPYQARTERKTLDARGQRRLDVLIQFDKIDAEAAEADTTQAMLDGGFREVGPPVEQPVAGFPATRRWFFSVPFGLVGVRVNALPGITTEDLVRGEIELDVPRSSAADTRELCPYPFQRRNQRSDVGSFE